MNEGNLDKTCPACGTRLRPHMRFCSSCGATVERNKEKVPGPGTQKYCPQCGTSLRPELKYCENCGAVIDQLPRCPACGDPISPGERFCNMCGLPLAAGTKAAAPAPAPAVQTPTPAAAAAPAGGTKAGGLSIGKIIAGVVIVLALLFIVILILPESPPPPPEGGGSTVTAGIVIPPAQGPEATQAAVDASNAVVQEAADALAAGDTAAFASCLVATDRGILEGDRLDPARSAAIAGAFRNAKIIAAFPGIVHYEMTVGNTQYTFYTTQEEGSWKIAGL